MVMSLDSAELLLSETWHSLEAGTVEGREVTEDRGLRRGGQAPAGHHRHTRGGMAPAGQHLTAHWAVLLLSRSVEFVILGA